MEKGITVDGKSLKEHLEAANHANALGLVHTLIAKKPPQLSEADVLLIHDIILIRAR